MKSFSQRHIGTRNEDLSSMLKTVGVQNIDELIDQTIPQSIRLKSDLNLPEALSEYEYMQHIRSIASKNKVFKSYIGLGYYGTITPSVIVRNILENPSWYTSYTPYQAEISQGRLEALLNFQTVIADLTGLELANASLLDEATAASEAMIMLFNKRSRTLSKAGHNQFFVDKNVFPQTLAVLTTKAEPLGIEVITGDYKTFDFSGLSFGALVQYPAADGKIEDYKAFVDKAHQAENTVAVAADLLSLAILTPPGEWGADVVLGSTQRLGVPMGFGGPHAAYFATKDDFKRNMPGRIIGVSKDAQGNLALRMALQTREQHIKREKATSNICTAQALLATMAGMYAVYHGAEGLKAIATDIHKKAGYLNDELIKLGYQQDNVNYFDTLRIQLPQGVTQNDIKKLAEERQMNFYYCADQSIFLSVGEDNTIKDINTILEVFALANHKEVEVHDELVNEIYFDRKFERQSEFLTLDVFKNYHSETDMMRYIKKLERKDISLTHSMISLGSCTMKLNAATEMFAITWPEFNAIHPFVPKNQAEGYYQLIEELGDYLKEVTGFAGISFQPNSGASGEYAGLMTIREYHKSRGEGHRNVVLIPSSAHGTNPASAVMAGQDVVIVECDEKGNINIEDLKIKAEAHKDQLAAFMVTYPSTHGVFEEGIIEMTNIIHNYGGLVYMDGANMNAQVGLTNPGRIGADVCHLNLHKTFAIPHGGGGPGVGPIAVNEKLVEFLPSNPLVKIGGNKAIAAISAAPFGSASVLPISHAYVMMLGAEGLKDATKYAIFNANYLASSLKPYFDILYTGNNERVAHEMILECRNFSREAHISESDIAKRLMDYGFHAPTLSFPVHGTLMVEPTESESKAELDRFIETMVNIYHEIMDVKNGKANAEDNVLKNAPHTQVELIGDEWAHPYSRTQAAYPLPWVAENKFFPSVARLDDAYGDRNLQCSCAPIDSYRKETFEVKTIDL
ncbi:MAG: aminomethyl-transferring glycine dehydrogenase [Bacteroidales bacterium]|nr:aminomethyl-transferring glycine dehydrogenase [Bacteroidales bacterium]